jgi:hypothetical protein
MARVKNQKKVSFYKQRRKGIPGITDAELLAMWNKKVADEKAVEDAKKVEVEAKEATKDPEPNVVDGATSS